MIAKHKRPSTNRTRYLYNGNNKRPILKNSDSNAAKMKQMATGMGQMKQNLKQPISGSIQESNLKTNLTIKKKSKAPNKIKSSQNKDKQIEKKSSEAKRKYEQRKNIPKRKSDNSMFKQMKDKFTGKPTDKDSK